MMDTYIETNDGIKTINKIEIIDVFTGYDGLQYCIYEYCNYIYNTIVYLVNSFNSDCSFSNEKNHLTKEEAEEKKKNIINGTEPDLKESKFEQEIISEDIAYMPEDEFNEEYYYNTITGKKIEK